MSVRRPTLLAAALLLATSASAVAPATAEPPTPSSTSWAQAACAGRTPTVVGTSGVVRGTSGADVIVAAGSARKVLAGDGDDVICVRVGADRRVKVRSGDGDDRVVVQRARRVVAMLGRGEDDYLGGSGPDLVATELDSLRDEAPGGGDRNVVRTRGGNDQVLSGTDWSRNRDVVRLGAGNDRVVPLAVAADGAKGSPRIEGGDGWDTLHLETSSRATLRVDATLGHASVGKRQIASWSGLEEYALSGRGRRVFLGSDVDERVFFDDGGPVVARTGAGEDAVLFGWGAEEDPPSATVDGGAGADLLAVQAYEGRTVASLATGRLETTHHGATTGFDLRGFEDLSVNAALGSHSTSVVEVHGDAGPNELQATACEVVLRGGAGDDLLRVGGETTDSPVQVAVGGEPSAPTCRGVSQVYGEEGDDVMVAAASVSLGPRGRKEFDDLLDGGEGTDTADGGAGDDTCLAETRTDCER